MHIAAVTAREILASGGFPTLEVTVSLENGSSGTASVPYGASAGTHEATVLLDEDPTRYLGKGMLKAVANVKQLGAHLVGMKADDQKAIDAKLLELDGTTRKKTYGGNTILAISMGVARAAASAHQKPLYKYLAEQFETGISFNDPKNLPKPMVVAIEGGKHADNTTDLQEFCLTAINNDDTPTEAIRKTLESYHHLKKVLKAAKLSTNVGNEGAFAPNGISSNEKPFEYMLEAINNAGYQPGTDIGFSIDAAASEFYVDGKYQLKLEKLSLTSQELIEHYRPWFEKYPMATVEDLLDEDDWENWPIAKQLCDAFNVPLLGDDLTVTNPERLAKALELNAISSILIKLNQIGSVSETIAVCKQARAAGLTTVTSHRGGGESNDTFMVDVAAACGSSHIKVGPTRGERVAKYNRLMAIEEEVSK
jgi:enolase